MIQWFTKQLKMNNEKGFTLIELLIVLAVMALIATIAFPAFTGLMDGFRHSADEQTANAVARQLQSRHMTGVITLTTTNQTTFTDFTSVHFGEALPDLKTNDTVSNWQYNLTQNADGTLSLQVQIDFASSTDVNSEEYTFTDVE